MTKKLLEAYINQIIRNSIQEITARKGTRTGGFEFDEKTINELMDKVKSIYSSLANDPERTTKSIKDSILVRSPITDKNYKIPLKFYWDIKDKATASATPYRKGAKGLMSINLANRGDESWLRSVIVHELTHLFDPQIWNDLTDNELSVDEYYSQKIEQKAWLNTVIQGMMDSVKEIKTDLNSTDEDDRKAAKRRLKIIIEKPWRLYEELKSNTYFKNVLNYYSDDPNSLFMKKLNTAAYQITQNNLVPLQK